MKKQPAAPASLLMIVLSIGACNPLKPKPRPYPAGAILETFSLYSDTPVPLSRWREELNSESCSLGVGVLFATGITLIPVPSIYHMLEDLRKILKAFRRLMPGGEETQEDVPW
jgi:hypothetical protein